MYLRGVENVDLSTTIFGKKLDLPFYLAPTALTKTCFITMEKGQLEKQLKNLIQCLEFQLLATVSVEEIASIS